jgi:hypothetical protein
MGGVVPEPRKAVMISVEPSWADQSGTLQTIPARMENKSAGGACIRIKKQIVVGAKLSVKCRWDQFVGIAKYCRSDGQEYLVGIQREKAKNAVLDLGDGAGRAVVPFQVVVRNSSATVSTAKIAPAPPAPRESKLDDVVVAKLSVETAPIVRIASVEAIMPRIAVTQAPGDNKGLGISPIPEFQFTGLKEIKPKHSRKRKGKEKKHMQLKWLDLAYSHVKQDEPAANSNGNATANIEKEIPAPQINSQVPPQAPPPVVQSAEAIAVAPTPERVAGFQVELLPIEDIYRAAGIANPRKGYSIHKVVEMLHSEHIRGLSKQMKRAAVLMALDAAGIPVDAILQDAKARQDALKFYEAEQKKQVKAELARKTEENIQIQAELERVKEHYMSRISRNLDAVAREKTKFSNWLTTKETESQGMSEAVEMCLKPAPPEPVSVPASTASLVEAGAKPV